MTKDIYKAIYQYFANYKYRLSNSYVFGWESDFFAISKSNYSVEVEVKVSRSDFKADFKKVQKHKILSDAMSDKSHVVMHGCSSGANWDRDLRDYSLKWTTIYIMEMAKLLIPNKFYYACPDGMIKKDEVPPYAGLFYYMDPDQRDIMSFAGLKQIKPAKFIHKRPQDYSKVLLDKFYYRCIDLEYKLSEMKQIVNRFQDIYQAPELAEGVDNAFYQQKLFD